jgi:hypothetical protein
MLMKLSMEMEMLYPPMKTPRGWHVLYQGACKTPDVFNLHERGLFKTRPQIASDFGSRLVVSEKLKVAIQHMRLIDSVSIDESTGERYLAKIERGMIHLSDDFNLDLNELGEHVEDKVMKTEIIRVYDEWFASLSTGVKGQEINPTEVKKFLGAVVDRGRKAYQEWLVRNNMPWIIPFLSRMIYDFRYGVYERVDEILYDCYKETGGEETEDDLIKKINLFMRIYQSEGLIKPNGSQWTSDDELWDCWVAFSGSEPEAKRICKTMEAVLAPLREELKKELGM